MRVVRVVFQNDKETAIALVSTAHYGITRRSPGIRGIRVP